MAMLRKYFLSVTFICFIATLLKSFAFYLMDALAWLLNFRIHPILYNNSRLHEARTTVDVPNGINIA